MAAVMAILKNLFFASPAEPKGQLTWNSVGGIQDGRRGDHHKYLFFASSPEKAN